MKLIDLTEQDFSIMNLGGFTFILYCLDKDKDYRCVVTDITEKAIKFCIVDDNTPNYELMIPKSTLKKVDSLESLYIASWVKPMVLQRVKCAFIFEYPKIAFKF